MMLRFKRECVSLLCLKRDLKRDTWQNHNRSYSQTVETFLIAPPVENAMREDLD